MLSRLKMFLRPGIFCLWWKQINRPQRRARMGCTDMTAERHTVTIETERTGQMVLTPAQFDLLMDAALVGLDGYEGPQEADADTLYDMLTSAAVKHRGQA